MLKRLCKGMALSKQRPAGRASVFVLRVHSRALVAVQRPGNRLAVFSQRSQRAQQKAGQDTTQELQANGKAGKMPSGEELWQKLNRSGTAHSVL